MWFNILIIHILGNIFSLRKGLKNMNTLGEFSAGFLTDLWRFSTAWYGTVRYGSVRFTFGGFSTGYCT